MDLVNKDGDRVQAKLASVPEEERKMLQRKSVNEDKAAPPPPKLTDNLASSVTAGFVHGVIVMMSFGSFAIVIFGQSEHQELKDALALAISQQVFSASLLIGILTFTGFFPFTMGGPTPPAALLIADVVRSVVDNVTDSEKKVPTALVTIAIVSVLMGLMLVTISATKTSVYALQLPFPVLCGFLGSVGVLLMRNAVGILVNLKLKWTFIPADFDKVGQLDPVSTICQLVLGFTVALLLLQGVPRVRAKVSKKTGLAVLPTLFLLPLVAFYAAVIGGGLDMSMTSELRTMQPPWLSPAAEWTWSPKDFFAAYFNVPNWDIGAIFNGVSILRMFISAFLCVIAALINMAGIETNAPQAHSLDLDKEFMSLGRANILVGLLGGHPGHHVAAFTLPMKKDGGTSRLAPWTASILWFVAFISAAPLSAIIPRFFFGGCFLQVGFGLARTFLWDNRKGLDRASICIALLTVAVAVFTDLNIASGVGFMAVAINFVRLSMDVNVVRAVERADLKRAPKYRTGKELQALKIHGHKIMVLYLEGYLFWGTVDEITGAFEELIDGTEDDPEIIYVDLRYVNGIELSVLNTFKKLTRLASNVGITIKLCSLPGEEVIGPGLFKLLSSLPFASTADLCSLIEKGEDDLLEAWIQNSPNKNYGNRRSTRSIIPQAVEYAARYQDATAYWLTACFKAMRSQMQDVKNQRKLRRTVAKGELLHELVAETGCSYAIRWEHINGDMMVNQTCLPDWRAEQLVRRALRSNTAVRTYVSESEKYSFPVDGTSAPEPSKSNGWPSSVSIVVAAESDSDGKEDLKAAPKAASFWMACTQDSGKPVTVEEVAVREVAPADVQVDLVDSAIELAAAGQANVLARAWASNKAILCNDVQNLSESTFKRKYLAQDFNIKQVIFIPFEDGVFELGAVGTSAQTLNETPVVLQDAPAKLLNPSHLKAVFDVASSKPVPEPASPSNGNGHAEDSPTKAALNETVGLLGKRISWNLTLAISTLGKFMRLTKDEPILVKPTFGIVSMKSIEFRATEFYIVLNGTFGTFRMGDSEDSEEKELILKSPPGTIIGADDVWAMRPRSVQLECLSDEGQVVALDKRAVKNLELGNTPFAGPEETEEFIDFMKREISLNMSIMECSFRNPEK